jgi:hypothetical protein
MVWSKFVLYHILQSWTSNFTLDLIFQEHLLEGWSPKCWFWSTYMFFSSKKVCIYNETWALQFCMHQVLLCDRIRDPKPWHLTVPYGKLDLLSIVIMIYFFVMNIACRFCCHMHCLATSYRNCTTIAALNRCSYFFQFPLLQLCVSIGIAKFPSCRTKLWIHYSPLCTVYCVNVCSN